MIRIWPRHTISLSEESHRRFQSAVYFLICLTMALIPCCSTVASPVKQFRSQVRHLASSELFSLRSRLDTTLVPRIASALEINFKSSFVWKNLDRSIDYIPVRYEQFDAETGKYMHMRCGIFVITRSGSTKFLPAFNDSINDLLQCSKLKAMRFEDAANESIPPRLLLLYGIDSPHASSESIVVFDWSEGKCVYAENEALENRLEADPKAVGIDGIERQLKSYKPH